MKTYAIVAAILAVIAAAWWLDRQGYQRAISGMEIAAAEAKAREAELVGQVNAARARREADNARFKTELEALRTGGACRPVHPDLRRLLDAGNR